MILMKDIIREGNPLLHQKTEKVEIPLSNEDSSLALDMLDYIYNSTNEEYIELYGLRPAVGIAAPQLGILKKIIAIQCDDEYGQEHEMLLINPKLLSYSDELTYLPGGEGCLSVDRKCDALIHRPRKITFEADFLNPDTLEITHKKLTIKGYLAVVFQHEYDHLNGILFVDRANKLDPYHVPENSTPIKFNSDNE